MKKILLIGMFIIGALSYGRDYEYREAMELQVVEKADYDDMSMISRNIEISKSNMADYSEFHRELEKMDKGNEKK